MEEQRTSKQQRRKRGTGTITKKGYVALKINGRTVFEHRLVMEEVLGRRLTKEERVHHKNHNRQDNRPDNLELKVSQSKHLEDEWRDGERVATDAMKTHLRNIAGKFTDKGRQALRDKASSQWKGVKKTPEHIAKQAAAMRGKPKTASHRRALRNAGAGRIVPDECVIDGCHLTPKGWDRCSTHYAYFRRTGHDKA